MDIWTDEMTGLVVSTAISILVPYLVYALKRYLKFRFDAAARETLDSAMRNGADWLIREGRAPTPTHVMEYVKRAAPDAVGRWKLDSENRELAEAGAGGHQESGAGVGLSVDNATGIVDRLRLPRFEANPNYDTLSASGLVRISASTTPTPTIRAR